MEMKILDISETEKKKKILNELSGYCIINLVCQKVFDYKVKIDENQIINYDFVNYDYDNNIRLSNEQYIKCAENYIEHLNNGGIKYEFRK